MLPHYSMLLYVATLRLFKFNILHFSCHSAVRILGWVTRTSWFDLKSPDCFAAIEKGWRSSAFLWVITDFVRCKKKRMDMSPPLIGSHIITAPPSPPPLDVKVGQ